MSSEYEAYRNQMIAVGIEFQDFIQDVFHGHLGLSVGNYQSKKYQFEKGENRAGIEIKRDGKFRTSGNLYIEISEKARPRGGDYVPSGIRRIDNTWLYVIGDEQTVFVFTKSQLVRLAALTKPNGEKQLKRVETPTSQGMLLPVSQAMIIAAKVIEIKQGVTA